MSITLSQHWDPIWHKPFQDLCMLPSSSWVHMYISISIVSGRHSFLAVIHHVWHLKSFLLLHHMASWTLWGGFDREQPIAWDVWGFHGAPLTNNASRCNPGTEVFTWGWEVSSWGIVIGDTNYISFMCVCVRMYACMHTHIYTYIYTYMLGSFYSCRHPYEPSTCP